MISHRRRPRKPARRLVPVAVAALAACAEGEARPADVLDTTAVAVVSDHLRLGLEALRRDSAGAAIRHFGVARDRNPRADQIVYLHAYAHLVAKEPAGVARWLDTLAARHSCLAPPAGGGFASMDSIPAVHRALERLADGAPTRHASEPVIVLAGWRDLFPEGIAYDPRDGSIFLSSLRRHLILRVTRQPDGTVTAAPFTQPGRDTLYSVIGLDVDAARRRLWALTAAEGFAAGEAPDEEGRSALLVYDLESGRTLRRIPITKPPPRLTNDLTLDSTGAAYVTDTEAGTVYRASLEADSVETLFPFGTFVEPNGIEITPDGRGLLVADGPNGIWYVDLPTRLRRRLPQPLGLMPLFLDGLAVHGGSLIGVSHALAGGWILRFTMAPTWDGIRAASPLDCNNPAFRQPTTAVVAGDTLFFVATSQFGRIPPPDRAVDPTDLVPTTIMKIPLPR